MRGHVLSWGGDDHAWNETKNSAEIRFVHLNFLIVEPEGAGEGEEADEVDESKEEYGGADDLDFQSGFYLFVGVNFHDVSC